jgi:hypothetical protein
LLKNLAIQSAASRPEGLAGCCEALCSSAAERRDYVAFAVSRQQFFSLRFKKPDQHAAFFRPRRAVLQREANYSKAGFWSARGQEYFFHAAYICSFGLQNYRN